jgi:ketosteroid isomerase-like protein
MRLCTGNNGRGVAESLFHGTRIRDGQTIEAVGAEVMDIVDGKIKEIRDYHRPVTAKARA